MITQTFRQSGNARCLGVGQGKDRMETVKSRRFGNANEKSIECQHSAQLDLHSSLGFYVSDLLDAISDVNLSPEIQAERELMTYILCH